MREFVPKEKVVFLQDYSDGNTWIPRGTQGEVVGGFGREFEVATELGVFLVEVEFLGSLEGLSGVGEKYEFDLEKKRRRGEDLMGGSHSSREINIGESADLVDRSPRGFGRSIYRFTLGREYKGHVN